MINKNKLKKAFLGVYCVKRCLLFVSWIGRGGKLNYLIPQPSAVSPNKVSGRRLRGPLITSIGSRGVLKQYSAVRSYGSKAALLESGYSSASTKVSGNVCIKPVNIDGATRIGIKQIISEITNNPMYIRISQILYLSIEKGQIVNNRKKQELIEETLTNYWYKELLSIFKNKKNLFNNSIGIKILINSILKLEKILNKIKKDKRYLMGKSYANHIRITENSVIISIVISNIIPHIMKNHNLEKTASLFKKIGLELHKNLLDIEWEKYNKTKDYLFDVSSIVGSLSIQENQIALMEQLEVDNNSIDYVSTTETKDRHLNGKIVNKLTDLYGLNSKSMANIEELGTNYPGFSPYGSEFEGFSGIYPERLIVEDESFAKKEALSKEEFSKKLDEILGKISSDDYFKLGLDLTEIIASNSNFFKIINIADEDNTVKRVIVPDKDIEIEIFRSLAIYTEKLVMIWEPCKWVVNIKDKETKDFDIIEFGGLLSNRKNKNSFIIKSHKNSGETKLDNEDIINTINYLSSIPFTINTQVLKHLLILINGNYCENNSTAWVVRALINERIILNMHPETSKLYNLGLKNKQGKIQEILKHNSQYFSDKSIITSALLFSSWCESSIDNKLYFNYIMDWRGRLYTDTSYLSFQGGELARSLLMFKNGTVLNSEGLEALKVYTANCYGLDKKSYNDRLNWTEENLDTILSVPDSSSEEQLQGSLSDLIRASEDSPHESVRGLQKGSINFYKFMLLGKEPLLFLSCCVELKNYYADPNNFVSRLPIYLDATCSGLQHLSRMINDSNLAEYVNILNSTRYDIPNDVYSHMISFVNEKIQGLIEKDNSLAILNNIEINREFIKPGIMTISYGSTAKGIADKLKSDHFKRLDLVKGEKVKYLLISKEFNKSEFDIHLTNGQILKLGGAIHSVLFDRFPNLTILVKFLKDLNKLLRSIKLPTIWLTPAGIIIEQNYPTSFKKEISTSILGKRNSIIIEEMNKEEIDIRKQNNAIVPNIVHSFDASNIALLIKIISSEFNNNKMNLLTIHDCFATNANDVDKMRSGVKLAFLALYSEKSFIDSYYDFIIDFIKKSGFKILEKTIDKGITAKWVVTSDEDIIIKIPEKPSFTNNDNLNYQILNSQYFIN